MFTGACDGGDMAVAMGYNSLKHVFVWSKVCPSKQRKKINTMPSLSFAHKALVGR